MSLLDKAKGAAKVVGQKAQQGAKAVGEKADEVKTKKRIDGLKEELGGIVYLQRTGNAPVNADAEIGRIVAEIKEAETHLEDDEGGGEGGGESGDEE